MADVRIGDNVGRVQSELDTFKRDVRPEPGGPLAGVLDRLSNLLDAIVQNTEPGTPARAIRAEVARLVRRLDDLAHDAAPQVRARMADLARAATELDHALSPSLEIPSRPLFGVLPLARVIPQDVHSVLDYKLAGLAAVVPALFAHTFAARATGLALGASVASVSALTDYRLSLANVIPIEVHEVLDYAAGAAAIAAPFVLGYARRDPVVAALHVAGGVAGILVSLFTDYRAAKGRGHSKVESAAMMGARLQPGLSTHLEYGRG